MAAGEEESNHQRQIDEEFADNKADQHHHEMRCGWCCWRPDGLQVGYNWKFGLAMVCWFSLLYGMLANGLNNVNTTPLELRFNIQSEQIGWFIAASKFSLASTTIIFSYYADRTHKPRILSLGSCAYAIGSLLLAIPHFVMEPYKSSAQDVPYMCNAAGLLNSSSSAGPVFHDCSNNSPSSYFGILIAGNVFIGIGNGIIFTVGLAFVDDFSTAAASGLYIGAVYLVNAVGTAVGFGAGSLILTLDVNFNYGEDKKGAQDSSDPSYVGAWWLGYLICSGLFATAAFAFSCFDRELPETAKLRAEKLANAQTHAGNKEIKVQLGNKTKNTFLNGIAGFLGNIIRHFGNPVAVCIALASVMQFMEIDGLTPFLVKLMRIQFGISETSGGLAVGVLVVLGIAFGCFLSGLMTKRMDMSPRSLLLVVLVFTLLCLSFSFTLTLSCSKEKMAGVTVDYYNATYYDSSASFDRANMDSSCNAGCQCQFELYEPVCLKKAGLEFYSSCYAGCRNYDKKKRSFSDCSCLPAEFVAQNVTSVDYGICDTVCWKLYAALIGLFLALFCGFFVTVPVTETIMRIVPNENRSFGLAFNQAMYTFLGSIPGPLLMGSVFDKACMLHQPKHDCSSQTAGISSTTASYDNNLSEDKGGACIVYDSDHLSLWLAGIIAALNLVALLLYVIAFIVYKPPNGETMSDYFRNLFKWWQTTLRHGKQIEPIKSEVSMSSGAQLDPPDHQD